MWSRPRTAKFGGKFQTRFTPFRRPSTTARPWFCRKAWTSAVRTALWPRLSPRQAEIPMAVPMWLTIARRPTSRAKALPVPASRQSARGSSRIRRDLFSNAQVLVLRLVFRSGRRFRFLREHFEGHILRPRGYFLVRSGCVLRERPFQHIEGVVCGSLPIAALRCPAKFKPDVVRRLRREIQFATVEFAGLEELIDEVSLFAAALVEA